MAPTQGHTPTGWECYTNLVRGPSGEINLTAQTHEVKIVVRLAIRAIMADLCFVDFYPSSTTRAAWHVKALTSAARTLQNGAAQKKNERVAHHYKMVRERLKTDEDYVPVLGKIVCPLICPKGLADHHQLDGRIPIFRNNLKSCAEQTVIPHFKLRAGCSDEVEWYMSKMRYVYPCDYPVRQTIHKTPLWVLCSLSYRNKRWMDVAHTRTVLSHL
jgi:hypothetical protein